MPLWKRVLQIALLPLVIPGILVGVLAILIMLGCAAAWMYPQSLWRDWKFRRFLRERGRIVDMEWLRPRLEAGEGTLIEEFGPKGTYLVWWTNDDLASLDPPMEERERIKALFTQDENDAYHQVRAFNSLCLTEYIARDAGKANLTTIPPRQVRSGKLARDFPTMKNVMVVPPPFWWRDNRVA